MAAADRAEVRSRLNKSTYRPLHSASRIHRPHRIPSRSKCPDDGAKGEAYAPNETAALVTMSADKL
jgi:hypothetical protein